MNSSLELFWLDSGGYPICPAEQSNMAHLLFTCVLLGVLGKLLISGGFCQKTLEAAFFPHHLKEDEGTPLDLLVQQQDSAGVQGY